MALIEILEVVGGAVGAMVSAFAIRDLYACAGHVQRSILSIAALTIPKAAREETRNAWRGDIAALPPSELLRTLYAIDCIRGGVVIGFRTRRENRSATTAVTTIQIDTSRGSAKLQIDKLTERELRILREVTARIIEKGASKRD